MHNFTFRLAGLQNLVCITVFRRRYSKPFRFLPGTKEGSVVHVKTYYTKLSMERVKNESVETRSRVKGIFAVSLRVSMWL